MTSFFAQCFAKQQRLRQAGARLFGSQWLSLASTHANVIVMERTTVWELFNTTSRTYKVFFPPSNFWPHCYQHVRISTASMKRLAWHYSTGSEYIVWGVALQESSLMPTLFSGGLSAARVTVPLLLRLFSPSNQQWNKTRVNDEDFYDVVIHWCRCANAPAHFRSVIKCKIGSFDEYIWTTPLKVKRALVHQMSRSGD